MSLKPDRDSVPCTKEELELFSVPPVQVTINDDVLVAYHPLATLSDGAPIEFVVPGAADCLLDLSQSYLHIRCKVVKDTSTALVATSAVAPVNLLLHSLFSQCDCELNGKQVSNSDNGYAYRSYIETLLTYGGDAVNSHLSTQMWEKDTAGQFEETSIGDTAKNLGFKKRNKLVAASKIVDLYGRPHCDLFQQDRLLLNNVDLRLKLTRSKDAFCLMTGEANPTYRVNIMSAVLYVRRVIPSPAVLIGFSEALKTNTVKYPIRRVEIKTFTIPINSRQGNLDNVVLGNLPSFCLLGFVSNGAFNGDYSKNPFNFHHYNVNYLALQVDGKTIPAIPYKPDYADNLYVRNYYSLFQALDKLTSDSLPRIPYEDYPRGNALYAFDLTSDKSQGQCHYNLIKQGALRVDVTFKQALTETINLVLYLVHQAVLEIDQSKNVIYEH